MDLSPRHLRDAVAALDLPLSGPAFESADTKDAIASRVRPFVGEFVENLDI